MKHVPVVLTALLVPQVVHIPQLLVLSEPMPVVQHRANHVVLGNTTTKQIKLPNLAVNHVVLAKVLAVKVAELTAIVVRVRFLRKPLRMTHASHARSQLGVAVMGFVKPILIQNLVAYHVSQLFTALIVPPVLPSHKPWFKI